jgi:hypothetical protein
MILKTGLQRRLQICGIWVFAGLLVELVSLFFLNRPSSFVIFMFLGGLLIAAGILLYLYSLVAPPQNG